MSDAPTIHATCVVFAETGVLIRGAPGAGKSSLAAALIDMAEARGGFGRLVADDRVRLEAVGGRLIASPPPSLAGLMERRGVGIVRVPYLAEAVVTLVVDLQDRPTRLPDPAETVTALADVELPRVAVSIGDPGAAGLVAMTISRRGCDQDPLAFAPQHEKVRSSAPHARHSQTDCAEPARSGPHPERNEFCAETA